MTGFAELLAATHYSFLRGAAHPADMVLRAVALGMTGIGIADRNTVAGVVKAHQALKDLRKQMAGAPLDFRLIVGARLVFADGTPDILAYPIDRTGWGSLTRLLTIGNRRTTKGACELHLNDLLDQAENLLLIAVADETHEFALRRIARHAPLWIAATMPRQGDDARRLARLMRLAQATGLPLIASCDALYATPEQRPLHDIVTCIRLGVTLAEAGTRLLAHAERHLKAPAEMARLFQACPQAVAETVGFLDRIHFSLDDLSYEYPHEAVPEGWDAQAWLEHETLRGAAARFPQGVPAAIRQTLDEEFALIRQCRYAHYFLTVYEAVKFARSVDPPILCHGRG
jgi:error-prone DNA polymerase